MAEEGIMMCDEKSAKMMPGSAEHGEIRRHYRDDRQADDISGKEVMLR